jgi:hypothetical protein
MQGWHVHFTTRELSPRTWPDYERFFSSGYGWDHCACVACEEPVAPDSVLPSDASPATGIAYSGAPMVLVLEFDRR